MSIAADAAGETRRLNRRAAAGSTSFSAGLPHAEALFETQTTSPMPTRCAPRCHTVGTGTETTRIRGHLASAHSEPYGQSRRCQQVDPGPGFRISPHLLVPADNHRPAARRQIVIAMSITRRANSAGVCAASRSSAILEKLVELDQICASPASSSVSRRRRRDRW